MYTHAHVQFTGAVVDGSHRFHFTCNLSKFVAPVNDFTQGLAPYADDPARFTTKLSSVTEGEIVVTGITENDTKVMREIFLQHSFHPLHV